MVYRLFRVHPATAAFFGVYLSTWHRERLFAVPYSRGRAHIMQDTRRRWRRCVLAIGIGFGRRVVASSSSFRARSRSLWQRGRRRNNENKVADKEAIDERSYANEPFGNSGWLGRSKGFARDGTVTGVPLPRTRVGR